MVLVGTATVAIIGLVGRRVGGNRVGIVAGLIALANPNLWINDSLTMSESLAALFVALLVWSGLALADEPNLRRSIVTGLTLGVTLLARSELGWFIPLMVLPILLGAFWLLLIPSAVGLHAIYRRAPRAWLWPFVACLGCSLLTAATFYGIPRFRIALDVAQCVLAAIPIAAWTGHRQDVMSLRRNHQ